MKLDIERGKHISAHFSTVQFVVENLDITTILSRSRLRIIRVTPGEYTGGIFGAHVHLENLDASCSGKQGILRTLSDIRLPFGFGRTYAKTSNVYYAINEKTTSLDLKLEIEMTGLMCLYAKMRKRAIDQYIDRICTEAEIAAQKIESGEYVHFAQLSQDQKKRVDEFRKRQDSAVRFKSGPSEILDASVNITVVKNTAVVLADAIMPDKHFMNAKHELLYDLKRNQYLCSSANRLARINNPAFVVRGETDHDSQNIEFRQAAFEFGHHLFSEYFAGDLRSMMPVLSYGGNQTFLRFAIDEKLEALPWEALHDGKDFLATRLRFARSIGSAKHARNNKDSILENFGILLIGSDSRGDLPGTTAEVQNIGKILSNAGAKKLEVLTGPDASRQNVISVLSSGAFNAMHFSGHSVFNSEYPYQSYLELAHGGKLYLHELDQINAGSAGKNSFDLIFLNSCQSGRTGIDQASGRSLSLCRVLREAGVENVIGMLWNVSDEAAVQVASTFYEYIATGQYIDVTEALRQTRCKVAIDRAWQDGSWLAPVLYV
jgi:hypothetical protein